MSNGSEAPKPVQAFLRDEYRAKVEIVTKQYERILTRFNYFLTIELALIGGVGFLATNQLDSAIFLLSTAGLVSTGLWFLTSLADRKLVEAYRTDVTVTYVLILSDLLENGGSVGRIRKSLERSLNHYAKARERSPLTNRSIAKKRILLAAADTQDRADLIFGLFSVTRMPIWASLGTVAIWLGCFYFFWNQTPTGGSPGT